MSFGIGISLTLTLKIQSAEANDARDAVRITSRPKSESIFLRRGRCAFAVVLGWRVGVQPRNGREGASQCRERAQCPRR